MGSTGDGQQSDLAALWEKALSDYSEQAKVDIRKEMQSRMSIASIRDDQEQELQVFVGFRHNKGKTDRLRSLIARNAKVIQTVATHIANAASSAFPPSVAVLTAFTYVMNASRHVSDDYDAIEGFFDLMNWFLERLSLLEGKLPRQQNFQVFLVRVFASLLSISGIARAYFLKGRFMKWAKALVEGRDPELKAALDGLKEALQDLESATLMQTLRTAIETQEEVRAVKEGVSALAERFGGMQASMNEHTAMIGKTQIAGECTMAVVLEMAPMLRELTDSNRKSRQDQESTNALMQAMMQSLMQSQDKIRPNTEKIQGGKEKRVGLKPGIAGKEVNLDHLRRLLRCEGEGSIRARLKELQLANPRMFKWIATGPLMEDVAQERLRFLWVSGKSGMGKSTVAYNMSLMLQDRFVKEEEKSAYVVPFFFEGSSDWAGYSEPGCTQLETMMRWVGMRLAEKDAPYCDELLSVIRRDEGYEHPDYYWNHVIKDRFPKSSARRLVLVLDGFDLLSTPEQMSLEQFFLSAKEEGLRVQLILTGNPKAGTEQESAAKKDIVPPFFGDGKIELTKDKVERDMRKLGHFLCREISRLGQLRESFRKMMVKKVASKADNLFYIEHMMRRFASLRREGLILKELDSLPSSITQLYETLVDECKMNRSPGEIEALRNLFAWLTYADGKLTVAEASEIISVFAKDNQINIEEELDGRLSRLLRIWRSKDDEDKVQDSGASDTDESDNEPDEGSLAEEQGFDNSLAFLEQGFHKILASLEQGFHNILAFQEQGFHNILAFQERSLREFFKQAGEDHQGLKCSPSDAHAIIFRIIVAILRKKRNSLSVWTKLVSYSAENWYRHFSATDLDKVSDEQAAQVLESLHSLFTNMDNALREVECVLDHTATILPSQDGADSEAGPGAMERLKAWARKALQLPPGTLPYGLTDWFRPLASEPARVFITLARSHISNWFAAETAWRAFASFKAAQNALREGGLLPELRQNDRLRQYFDEYPSGCETLTKHSFEVVAGAFWDIVKTAKSHRGIAKAMIHKGLYELAIAQLDISLSLVEDGADKEVERLDAISTKGEAFVALARQYVESDPTRAKELWAQGAKVLEEVLVIHDEQVAQNPELAIEVTFSNLYPEASAANYALACAKMGNFEASLETIRRHRSYTAGRFYLNSGAVNEIIKAMVDGGKSCMVIELIRLLTDMEKVLLFASALMHHPMFRAIMREGQGETLVEILDSCGRYAAKQRMHRSRSRILEIAGLFAIRSMGQPELGREKLRTILAEPEMPPEDVHYAADMMVAQLLEQFRHSTVPQEKAAALQELRDVQARVAVVASTFDPHRDYSNVALALMLRRLGPALEYADVLNATFQSCVRGLRDDTGANDSGCLRLLAKVLMCVEGLEYDAQIALTAHQYILDDDIFKRESQSDMEQQSSEGGSDTGDDEAEPSPGDELPPPGVHGLDGKETKWAMKPPPVEAEAAAAAALVMTNGDETPAAVLGNGGENATGHMEAEAADKPATLEEEIREGLYPDAYDFGIVCDGCSAPVCRWAEGETYYCVQCFDIDICGPCMRDKLARERGEMEPDWQVFCPEGHTHVKGPVEGWRGVRQGRLRIKDEEIPVKKWLTDLEAKWAAYWRGYWSRQD